MLSQTALDLDALSIGKRLQFVRFRGHAIPQIFRQLNSLGGTQLEQFSQKVVHLPDFQKSPYLPKTRIQDQAKQVLQWTFAAF